MADVKQFVLLILLLMAMMLVFVNRIISVRISRPIMKLDHSVREYQEGKEEKIAIGGSTEIRHLGQSIQESYRQNSELMKKSYGNRMKEEKANLMCCKARSTRIFIQYIRLHHLDDRER